MKVSAETTSPGSIVETNLSVERNPGIHISFPGIAAVCLKLSVQFFLAFFCSCFLYVPWIWDALGYFGSH